MAWYAHRAQLREEGQLLGCLDAVVMLEVRAELRSPPPHSAPGAPAGYEGIFDGLFGGSGSGRA